MIIGMRSSCELQALQKSCDSDPVGDMASVEREPTSNAATAIERSGPLSVPPSSGTCRACATALFGKSRPHLAGKKVNRIEANLGRATAGAGRISDQS